jgi:hypothetical protein
MKQTIKHSVNTVTTNKTVLRAILALMTLLTVMGSVMAEGATGSGI